MKLMDDLKKMTIEDIIQLQEKLSGFIGVSGFEDDVREFIKAEITPLVDKIWTDSMGNLLAIKNGKNPNAHKLLLDAHMDEVGFIINYIEEDGYLRFGLIGGFDKRILLGQAVLLKISKDKIIHGVIGAKPPHLISAEEGKKPVDEKDLYIDIGLSSKKEVQEYGVEIGITGVLHDPFIIMPKNIIRGRAIDDRLGCNLIIQLLKRLKKESIDETLLLSFSVQEEVGLRGAGVSAFSLDPTIALAIETTTGDNNPMTKPRERPAEFEKGPSITIMDSNTITNKQINERLIKNADLAKINYQFKKPRIGGGTNAGKIHLSRSGVATGIISVPCKYLHSPIIFASIIDAIDTLNLLEAFIRNKAEVLV
jgi:endoglucanase